MHIFKSCPNCTRAADGSSSNPSDKSFSVYKCGICGSKYCTHCGGDVCPSCGDSKRSLIGRVSA
ncbi:MAG TPA: hypothetical protein VFG19_10715 [Geobacteraceae bacterium]|nr:hypothetical protein [Geobacteraceae bacterium]